MPVVARADQRNWRRSIELHYCRTKVPSNSIMQLRGEGKGNTVTL